MVERFVPSLQTAVLVALCFDNESGAEIAAQVKTTHFDGVYRDFASGVLKYRREFRSPPGIPQLEGIAEEVSLNREGRSLLIDELIPALVAAEKSFNGKYTASRVHDFIRHQQAKQALFDAGEAWDAERTGGPDAVPKIEKIFHDFLHKAKSTYSAGTFLSDPKALGFLTTRQEEFISIGIPELDRAGIGLYPKQLLLYIGPKGSGKTWFCCHCGRQAVMQHQKVVHYSLEEDGDTGIIPRYYQMLFGVGQSRTRFIRGLFTPTESGSIFSWEEVEPKLSFEDADIRKVLTAEIKKFSESYADLVVKTFPTSQLTVDMFTAHLDYLESVEGFVPNLVIVDYPKLMHTDPKNLRISLGRNVEELRGRAIERNFALVCPHQGTRTTIRAARVRSSDAGEDISVVQTADTVFSFQRTEKEEEWGIARLSVEHTRRAKSGLIIGLTQSYETGQYCTSSYYMDKRLRDEIEQMGRVDEVVGRRSSASAASDIETLGESKRYRGRN